MTASKVTITIAVLWGALLTTGSIIAASLNNNPCDSEWESLKKLETEERTRQWLSLNTKCANSGIYESRLGVLYIQMGLYDKAKAIVQSGLSLKSPYEKNLRSTLARIDLVQLKLDTALQQYESLIKIYPDWYDGYGGVGTVKLIQNKYEEAVYYLNEAKKREEDYYIYRNLVLAYHKLNQHEEVAKAIKVAYELDKGTTKDRDAMLAAARSYALMGKYKAADGFLKLLIQAKPEVSSDPEVVKVVNFVSKKLKEGQ